MDLIVVDKRARYLVTFHSSTGNVAMATNKKRDSNTRISLSHQTLDKLPALG